MKGLRGMGGGSCSLLPGLLPEGPQLQDFGDWKWRAVGTQTLDGVPGRETLHTSALPFSGLPLLPKLELFPVSISQSLVDVPELLSLPGFSLLASRSRVEAAARR